jgi:hypothetical protein
MSKIGRPVVFVATAMLLKVLLSGAIAEAQAPAPALPEEWAKVRQALEKYQDVIVALRDGYRSAVLCVQDENRAGMGIHFGNARITGPVPDPMRPTILLYEPVGNKLQLIGAEWFIPLATGVKDRPSLFGQPFDGPMEGHPPTQPPELHHYDLHVWLFKPNPEGMFKHFNPNVKCPGGEYTETALPPKLVPHPHR